MPLGVVAGLESTMCFVRATKRTPDDAKAKRENLPKHEEAAFWSPFSLEFFDSTEERRFQKAIGSAWRLRDFVGYWFSLVSGPSLAYSFRDLLPLWATLPVAFFCCIVAPLNIYNYLFRQ